MDLWTLRACAVALLAVMAVMAAIEIVLQIHDYLQRRKGMW